MTPQAITFTVIVCLVVGLAYSEPNGASGEKWAYSTVRPGAHMFWWLYENKNPTAPLVLWLQGGPGSSGTGFGNFEEIGPLDANLKPRASTWLSLTHLLFIDNPVGTGFSYVDSADAYTTNVSQIAADLLVAVKDIFDQLPHYQSVPFYIFSESYGGKMTAAFAQVLHQSLQQGSVRCNFKGFAMGDSWISPLDSVLTWGPFLYATSLVDKEGLAAINKTAQMSLAAFKKGQYAKSTEYWGETETVINQVAAGVNIYNIQKWGGSLPSHSTTLKFKPLKKRRMSKNLELTIERHLKVTQNDALSSLMNGPIRKKLGIIPSHVTWGGQSTEVFAKQSVDFMKPVVDVVDDILKNTDLRVVVYSGQLDCIVDTLGTELWVQKLTWPGLTYYNSAKRVTLRSTVTKNPIAFFKIYKQFSFYWILKAGHMVPADHPEAALTMLKMVTSGQ